MTDMPGGQSLGNAVGRITIDVSSLQRSVDAVEAAASKITSALQGINSAYKGMGAGLGAGLQNASKGAQSAAGQINNMSTALNKANTSGVRLSNTFERLAEYVFSFSAIFSAVNFAGQALQAARSIDVANIRFNQLTGSAAESRVEMEKLRDTAKQFGIPVNQAMDLFAGLVPLIENGRSSLQDYVKIMARMVLLSPEQGFQGAAFAIREALTSLGEGKRDFVSLSERFEIPKGLLRTALDQTGGDLAQGMDIVLNKLGITEDAAKQMGQTFDASLKMMGDEFKRFAATAIKPLLDGIQPIVKAMSDFMGVFISTNPELIKSVGSLAAMVGSLGAMRYILRELKGPMEDVIRSMGSFVNPGGGKTFGQSLKQNFFGKGAIGRFAGVGLPSLAIGTGIGQGLLGNIATMTDDTYKNFAFRGGMMDELRKSVRERAQKKVDELFGTNAITASEYINREYNQNFDTKTKGGRDQARDFAFNQFARDLASEAPTDTLKLISTAMLAAVLTFAEGVKQFASIISEFPERLMNAGKGFKTNAEIQAEEKFKSENIRASTIKEDLGLRGGNPQEWVEAARRMRETAVKLKEKPLQGVELLAGQFAGEITMGGIGVTGTKKSIKEIQENADWFISMLDEFAKEMENIPKIERKGLDEIFAELFRQANALTGAIPVNTESNTPVAGFKQQKEPIMTSDQFNSFRDYMIDLNNMAKEYEAQRVALRKENEVDRQKIQDKYNAQRKKTQERFDQDEIERQSKLADDIADIEKDSTKKLIEMRVDFAEDEAKKMRDHLRRLNELNADIADAAGKLDAVAVRRLQEQKAKEEREFRESRDERSAEQTKRLTEEQDAANERIEQLRLNYDREKKLRDDNLKRDLQTITDIETEEQATREAGFIEKMRQLKDQEDQERALRDQRYIDEMAAQGDHNAAMIKLMQAGSADQQEEAKKLTTALVAEYRKLYDQVIGQFQLNNLSNAMAGTPFGDLFATLVKDGLGAAIKQFSSNMMTANTAMKDGEVLPAEKQNNLWNLGNNIQGALTSLENIPGLIQDQKSKIVLSEIAEEVKKKYTDSINDVRTVVEKLRNGIKEALEAIPQSISTTDEDWLATADLLRSNLMDTALATSKTAGSATTFMQRVNQIAMQASSAFTSPSDIRTVLQNALAGVGSVLSWLSTVTGRIMGRTPSVRTRDPSRPQMTQFAVGTANVMSGGLYQLHAGEGVANSTNAALLRSALGSNYSQSQLTQFIKGGNGGVSFDQGSIVLNINGGGEPYAIKSAVKDAMAEVIHEYVARRTR